MGEDVRATQRHAVSDSSGMLSLSLRPAHWQQRQPRVWPCRMKEWGKRFLQPVAEWFGMRFPDRIVRVPHCAGLHPSAPHPPCHPQSY